MIPKVKRPTSRRMLTLEVLRRQQLSPHFISLTLGGDDLQDLNWSGLDQCARVFFPRLNQPRLVMPTFNNEAWMAQLLLLPKSRRPWARMYSLRHFRPDVLEVDIEIAVHGDSPGSQWARSARAGDPVGIFDEGYSYAPTAGGPQLIVADESALPPVAAILEQAPPDLVAEVVLEVPSTSDIRDLVAPGGVTVRWLARDNPAGRPGVLALHTIQQQALPQQRFYTWVAGEAQLATGLRRHLVNVCGLPKTDITFTGYWRHGHASPG